MKVLKVASWMVIIGLGVLLLVVGKKLLIPLFVAITIQFLINVLAASFGKLKVAGKRPPGWLTIPLASISIIGIFVLCVEIIRSSVEEMISVAPVYQANFDAMLNRVLEGLGFNQMPSLASMLEDVDLKPILVDIGSGISNFAGDLVLILIYVIFLLIEQRFFPVKLKAFFPEPDRYQQAGGILDRIGSTVRIYFMVKMFTSLLTGGLCYFILQWIGVDFALFWAFLIFLLNFIPSIGSIVATILVSLFGLLQFGEWSYALGVLTGVGAVQMLVGNYLDPRMLGRSLNISPFVVLFSLAVWGSVWGIIGMFLSVPLMVTLMIILSQFPSTVPFAVLLSENGRVLERPENESVHHEFPR